MKKIAELLKRFETPLTYGILNILFGIAFIASKSVLDIMITVSGIAICAVALIRFVKLTKRGDNNNPFFIFLAVREAILLLVGIVLIVMRSGVIDAVSTLIGIYVTLHFIIFLAMTFSRGGEKGAAWWTDVSLSVLLAILGIVLILNRSFLNIIIGAVLIIVGIDLIVKYAKSRRTKADIEDGNIYNAQFRDLGE